MSRNAPDGTPTGTQFTFDPPLKYGEDILVTVFNRTHALVRLRHGKAWGPEGPLKITQVQTGPMGPFPGFVAMISRDRFTLATGPTTTIMISARTGTATTTTARPTFWDLSRA